MRSASDTLRRPTSARGFLGGTAASTGQGRSTGPDWRPSMPSSRAASDPSAVAQAPNLRRGRRSPSRFRPSHPANAEPYQNQGQDKIEDGVGNPGQRDRQVDTIAERLGVEEDLLFIKEQRLGGEGSRQRVRGDRQDTDVDQRRFFPGLRSASSRAEEPEERDELQQDRQDNRESEHAQQEHGVREDGGSERALLGAREEETERGRRQRRDDQEDGGDQHLSGCHASKDVGECLQREGNEEQQEQVTQRGTQLAHDERASG